MDDSEILKILLRFQDYLSLTSIWTAPFRVIGWWVIMGLAAIVDALSGGIEEIYDLLNFFDSDQISGFIDKWMPVIFALMTLALGFLGWKIIVQKKTDYDKIITNSLFAVTLFLVLPWGMQQASDLLLAGKGMLDEDGKLSVSTKIYQNNIVDVYKIDKDAEWSKKEFKKLKKKNNIENDEDVKLLDITEPVDTGGIFHSSPLTKDGEKILDKKVSDASGEKKLEDLESFWIQDDEAYYRYSWHPWYMMFELGTIAFVLFMTMFKTAQLIMELGILKIFSVGTALTDLENGQRNKKFLEKIKNTFIVLFSIELLLQCYILFTDYIGQADISAPIKIVVLIAAAILTADGPNFIEEMFGIDAGLKSISRSLVGLFAGAKTAKMATDFTASTAKKAGKMAGKIAKKSSDAALVGMGAGKGILDGFKENMDAAKSSGGSNGGKIGKDGDTPLSHGLAGKPTNVMSDEALKEAMMSGDDQKEKDKSSQSDSPLSSLNKENSSDSSTEGIGNRDDRSGTENGSPMEDHNTPLSSMSSGEEAGSKNEKGTDNILSKDGDTPLQASKGQASPDEANDGLGTQQGKNIEMATDKDGNTPLSNMASSEGIQPGQPGGAVADKDGNTPLSNIAASEGVHSGQPDGAATDKDGNTPLSNMTGDNPIPGQVGGNAPDNSNTPLSPQGPTESPIPGQVGGSGPGSSNTPLSSQGPAAGPISSQIGGNTPITPGRQLSQGPINGGSVANNSTSDNGWDSLFATMPQNIGSHSSGSPMPSSPISQAPASMTPITSSSNPAISNASTVNSVTNGSNSSYSAPTPANNILPTHRASVGNVLPTYRAPVQNTGSGRFDYSPKVMSTVSNKPIGMPKHVQASAEAFKNQMTRRPTTNMTAKDVLVNKYADLAQRIHDSKSIRNSRAAYDIAKNTVTAGLKGESEK
ncbi:pLS20_p028 family conjugation system transmembrane protein [Bacillus subtilis]|uniref:pLS20_p028 family conjugation system transmembrane protein n=1 Tax=Bacillus subtilis TaxID=1423 RepID=UPI003F6DCB53